MAGSLMDDQIDALNADITANVALSEKKVTKAAALAAKSSSALTQRTAVLAEITVINTEIDELLTNYETLTGVAIGSTDWGDYVIP